MKLQLTSDRPRVYRVGRIIINVPPEKWERVREALERANPVTRADADNIVQSMLGLQPIDDPAWYVFVLAKGWIATSLYDIEHFESRLAFCSGWNVYFVTTREVDPSEPYVYADLLNVKWRHVVDGWVYGEVWGAQYVCNRDPTEWLADQLEVEGEET